MGSKSKYKDGGFPDNRERLFARGSDLAYLMGRADTKGITAITGRPKLGKTWLLHELCRSLSEANGHIVGYTRSTGQSSDLLLRSVANLYARWLANSSFSEQAQIAWKQQKKGLITHFGKFTGKAVEGVMKLTRPDLSAFAKAIEGVFGGLGAADRELKSGSLQMPSLDYDDAHALISMLAAITERPITLVLDAWEKSPDVEQESKLLHAILGGLEKWPNLHIFLALRADDPAHELVCDLDRSSPLMDIHKLRALNLQEDEKEKARMISCLRAHVSAVEKVSDEELLKMIQGYPGVIERWLEPQRQKALNTMDDLQHEADDAQTYRYREFDSDMPKVSREAHCFALRLSLIPQLSDQSQWETLKPILLDSLHEQFVIELQEKDILEPTETYPTFGHATRHEAATRWFESNTPLMLRQQEAERIIVGSATRIQNTSSESALFTITLASMGSKILNLSLSEKVFALFIAATTLLSRKPIRDKLLLPFLNAGLDAAQEYQDTSSLIAMGLGNTLIDAKKKNDLTRRNELLEQLRTLAADYPEDQVVREVLAVSLFNMLCDAKEENDLTRRNELLEELRTLAAEYPEDQAVRKGFAKGLFNTLIHTKEENDLTRRNELLEELRALAADYPEDPAVRESLAKGLFSTLNHAKEENDLTRCNGLLEQLRTLAAEYPEDLAVREQLAMGWVNTLTHAKEENNLTRRNELLEELRTLSAEYPEDLAVRKPLAMGLSNTLNHANEENDLTRRNELLEELRTLAADYPEDQAVREQLAIGLFNTLYNAKEENDLTRRNELLKALRKLAAEYPEDMAVRELLAKGLLNTLVHTKEENDLTRSNELLKALRKLAAEYPEDMAVRELLAKGLLRTLNDAKEENNLTRWNKLLEELRALAATFPEGAIAREAILYALMIQAKEAEDENDTDQADALREEI